MKNITIELLRVMTPPENSIGYWFGYCGELADAVLHEYEDATIVYFAPARESRVWSLRPMGYTFEWRWHMAVWYQKRVHCAWFPDAVLPVDDFIVHAFLGQEVIWDIT